MLGSLYAVSEEAGVLTLTSKNMLMVRVVENYVPMIVEHLAQRWGHPVERLVIEYHPDAVTEEPDNDALPLFATQLAAPKPQVAPKKPVAHEYGSPLDDLMTLETFIADSSNDEAFSRPSPSQVRAERGSIRCIFTVKSGRERRT